MVAAPAVSICVPTFNGAAFLEACLDSALAQSFRDFEVLVVDDASSDETVALASGYARRDARVRLVVNPVNLGLVENWNRCVALARGAWIKFLFQDDFLAPACLEHLVAAAGPAGPMAVGRRLIAYDPDVPPAMRARYAPFEDRWTVRGFFGARPHVGAQEFAAHVLRWPIVNCVGEPTAVLWHRSVFERFGVFDPAYAVLADWEYAARVAVHTGFAYVDEPLMTFRVQPGSATQTGLAHRRFRVAELDLLLMEHALAYGAAFEPVRRAAAVATPPVSLERRVEHAVVRARRALRRRYRAEPGARADWATFLATHPRVRRMPPTYRLRLRAARWAVLRRVERLLGRARA